MIYKRGKKWHIDVMVSGVRYREALETTDRREALSLEKDRVAEIKQGKGASKSGKEFARKPFGEAAKAYQEDREAHVSERTTQFERQRLRPLAAYFGERPLHGIKASEIVAYQKFRLERGVSGRTANMELGILRRMLKRAKIWSIVAEDVKALPERAGTIAKVLTAEQKRMLFETAASKPDWLVAHCAAVLAVSTTCRGIELKHLRWRDVDLFSCVMAVERSKTDAGHRKIPLNRDAVAALSRLLSRAQTHRVSEPEHFVFPACENEQIDATRPQKSWRTAWRNLVSAAGRKAGREAARAELDAGLGLSRAKTAWRRAGEAFRRFRFHDLRHQAITELAEGGASDATLMALAGHMSRRMLEHYSHVRMFAKRTALDKLESGLMGGTSELEAKSKRPPVQ